MWPLQSLSNLCFFDTMSICYLMWNKYVQISLIFKKIDGLMSKEPNISLTLEWTMLFKLASFERLKNEWVLLNKRPRVSVHGLECSFRSNELASLHEDDFIRPATMMVEGLAECSVHCSNVSHQNGLSCVWQNALSIVPMSGIKLDYQVFGKMQCLLFQYQPSNWIIMCLAECSVHCSNVSHQTVLSCAQSGQSGK